MNSNEFIIEPSTEEVINKFYIKSGYGTIDCNYERVYKDLKNSSSNYDQTNNKPILKSEFVYLPNFPSKVISYDKMIEYGKDKYYWDALAQKLYKFKIQESVNPFVKQSQVIVGTDGSPTQAINIINEFSKSNGIFKEVILDIPTSTYITVHGHPEQYAERPYQEGAYYFDDVHNKYYIFISNYTINKDNWYYDKTLENSTILKYLHDSSSWTTINAAFVLDGNPNNLIRVTEDGSDDSISIDDIDKMICYCDKTTDVLYYFDYGQYFIRILYSGTVYERPLEFYRNMTNVFFDINNNTKILTKSIYYVNGHPKKVKNPSEGRYYYDTKNQKYYEYSSTNNEWITVAQENIIIPQTFFPHTKGNIQKEVTLAYYDIIDCYTKKEVNNLIPVIPGYISAFENDIGYIFEHQDISGKQDNLTVEELSTLNSGVTNSKVNSWINQINLANNKQDTLSNLQMDALNSGITSDLVAYFDNIGTLINTKANSSTTLNGYGITDAYTENEIIDAILTLKNKLDGAN